MQIHPSSVWIAQGISLVCLAEAFWMLLGPWTRRGSFPRWRLLPYLPREAGTAGAEKKTWLPGSQGYRGSAKSLTSRLAWAGKSLTVSRFRRQQHLLAWAGLGVGAGLGAIGWWVGTLTPGGAVVLLCLPVAAYLWPDYSLSWQARSRQLRLNQELPDVIELLSLAVGAGESLYAALIRVSSRCSAVAGQELRLVVAQVEAGMSLATSLARMRARNDSEILAHLVDAVVGAMERGSPLAGVLREQVADSRAAARTQLLAEGGRKEIWMMLPVVFLILPLTVVFALYPGLMMLQL